MKHTSSLRPTLRARLLRTWSLLLALLVFASARGALAQDAAEPPAYRGIVREALSEYTAKNFPEARALFSEAHRLFPNARTLRGLGMTAFELRSYRESIGYLTEALDSKVKPLNDSLRAETERLLARAERFVGKLNVSVTPDEAEIVVDGNLIERGTPQPMVLEVGEHQLEFRAEGYVAESRTLYVKGRESTTWSVVLNKVPVAPVAAPVSALQPEQVAAQAEAQPSKPRYFDPNDDNRERPSKRPVYKSPWLWTGVGAVVVAAVVTSVVIATRDSKVGAASVGDNTPPGGVFSALEGRP